LYKNDKLSQIVKFRKSVLFTIIDLRICHFCTAQNYKVFWLKNLHDCRSQHTLSTCRFNFWFFWNFKIVFSIFLKNKLHVARATFVVFDEKIPNDMMVGHNIKKTIWTTYEIRLCIVLFVTVFFREAFRHCSLLDEENCSLWVCIFGLNVWNHIWKYIL
jgi:hypothetical protein